MQVTTTATRSPGDQVALQRGTASVQELRDRCRLLEEGIVYFLETPHGTIDAFNVEMDRLRELAAGFDRFVVIVDLAQASRPKPELIEHIVKCIGSIGIHWCAIRPGSRSLMRSVIQFVGARMTAIRSRLTMHESLEEAHLAAREILAKAARAQ